MHHKPNESAYKALRAGHANQPSIRRYVEFLNHNYFISSVNKGIELHCCVFLGDLSWNAI